MRSSRFVIAAILAAGAVLAPAAWAAGLAEGDVFPNATLGAGDGPVPIRDVLGELTVIDFWATWCPPCHEALPNLDRWAAKWGERGLVVLAVSIDVQRQKAQTFLDRRLPGASLRLLHDPGGDLLARIGAPAIPALYLVDAEGVVRRVETSYDPDRLSEVEQAIEEILRPLEPTP